MKTTPWQPDPDHTVSFLEFYAKQNVIPVKQDLTDLARHFARRDYLYRTLGLVPQFLRGRSVIEFGPGTGDNAVYTNHLQPGLYHLVDGNPASLSAIRHKIDHGQLSRNCTLINANFIEYECDQQFDLVICEGCIPGQRVPGEVLKRLGRFCAPGGMLITTTSSAVSYLAETCRQLCYPAIAMASSNFDEQVNIAASLFGKHLAFFQCSTRSIEDWVTDNILFHWYGVNGADFFSIPDALHAMDDAFRFHASSPRFFRDLRWYKTVDGNDPVNALVLEEYWAFLPALLDCRVDKEVIVANGQSADLAKNRQIDHICQEISTIRSRIIATLSYDPLDEVIVLLDQLGRLLPPVMRQTCAGMADFAVGIRQVAEGRLQPQPFNAFCNWWGRGQQYLSLIKNTH
ncbi:MAG: class I SAM-dependent methyltransferase [Magnetococcales bacterium]|nr:class I SAM-dependent methyltransferase [Magnetococcales bacterium]